MAYSNAGSQKLSLFAQTMLQADEEFYATFPEARPVPGPWQVGQIHSGHFQGACFYYTPTAPSPPSSSSPTAESFYDPQIDARVMSHGLHYDYSQHYIPYENHHLPTQEQPYHMDSLLPPDPIPTPVAHLSPVDSPSPPAPFLDTAPVLSDDHIKSESPDHILSSRRTRQSRRDQRDESRSLSHARSGPFRGWSSHRSPSPHPTMRLSPLPSRRPPEKKPSLACLFCRGRKIACGPPLPGSNTCNQCQRRSLVCEYPTESRRGMRKKKHSMEVTSPTTVEGKSLA